MREPGEAVDLDQLRALPYVGSVTDDGGIQAGTVILSPERSAPGYNLFSLYTLCRADLMDVEGSVLHSWSLPDMSAWEHVELLADGHLLMTAVDGSSGWRDDARVILRLDWNSGVVWKTRITAHHDAEMTPRHQILTLTFERRRIPEVDEDTDIRDESLTLLDLNGNVIESRSLYDLVHATDLFPMQPVKPSRLGGGALWIDLFHCNSIEWMKEEELFGSDPIYASGNVLVCSRHQDRVFILDWDKQELLWAWGQEELSGPHDAQLLKNGNLLIFDNGLGRSPQFSRVIELDPRSREIVWEYRAPDPQKFYTRSHGSAQRLANGNTLIAHSDRGIAFEVTPEGEVVWRFVTRAEGGERATVVRMRRYDPEIIEALLARYESD